MVSSAWREIIVSVEAGMRVLDAHPGRPLLVDLAEVGFVDSSGLGGLVQLSNLARARGVELRLANVSRTVRAVIDLAGLNAVLPCVLEQNPVE